jgi:hypothetical protein
LDKKKEAMFTMTANVAFEGLKPIKPRSLSWKRHIDNLSDTAKIEIPAICRYIDTDKTYDNVVTGQKFTEGQQVLISAGYDGNNRTAFFGFIKRINSSVPLEIECEGYSYQLRNCTITKRFGKTTVRKVIEYLIAETDIKISDKVSGEIDFEPKVFDGVEKISVLNWLKENYKLKIFFIFDTIYFGFGITYKSDKVKYELNWNVIKDNDLLFNTYTSATVNIEGYSRKADGTLIKTKAANANTFGAVKKIKMLMRNKDDLQAATNEEQLRHNKKGYVGSLTSFLVPYVKIGMTAEIIDKKFKERQGSYLVDGVEGSFGPGGGRQKVHIDFSVKANG